MSRLKKKIGLIGKDTIKITGVWPNGRPYTAKDWREQYKTELSKQVKLAEKDAGFKEGTFVVNTGFETKKIDGVLKFKETEGVWSNDKFHTMEQWNELMKLTKAREILDKRINDSNKNRVKENKRTIRTKRFKAIANADAETLAMIDRYLFEGHTDLYTKGFIDGSKSRKLNPILDWDPELEGRIMPVDDGLGISCLVNHSLGETCNYAADQHAMHSSIGVAKLGINKHKPSSKKSRV